VAGCGRQLESGNGQAGPSGVADKPVVPMTSGNADRGKGLEFGYVWEAIEGIGIGFTPTNSTRGQAIAEHTGRACEGAESRGKRTPALDEAPCARARLPSESRMRDGFDSGTLTLHVRFSVPLSKP
jgi:hypothetical protein